ncbi:WD40-repeat-containing domain protein [Myxozyma melibiosi]|uniref:WD40-repeat-containing domain protein n=1 Tax=Myxozyma melibiosi TaxID=54550 RepID=A0ABR1FA56_9ASCO
MEHQTCPVSVQRSQQRPPTMLPAASVALMPSSASSSSSSAALISAYAPEPPTPAPSPTPYGGYFFPRDGHLSNESEDIELHDADDTSVEHSDVEELPPLERLAHDFAALELDQRKALLAALFRASDTATLSFVLEFVSPLLKVDPFRVLPTELCLRVLSYVDDPKTLARAAQVSRRWAMLVSDDIIWKGLCDRLNYDDHFTPAIAAQTASAHRRSFDNPAAAANDAALALATATAPQTQPPTRPVSMLVASPPTAPTPLTTLPVTVTSSTLGTTEVIRDLPLMKSTYTPVLAHAYRPRTYRAFIKQRYMIDSAWLSAGTVAARHVTTDQGVVTCLHLTDKYIAVALDNSRIHVFTADGRLLHTLLGHVMGVWAIMPWGDTLVSGGCDRDLRVWDLVTGTCKRVMRGHTSTVRCLKMSDSRTAISGSRDANLRVWDIETGECLHVLTGHQASVRCLEVYGDICVSGSYDTTAKVWSISRGVLLHTLNGHFSQIYALAFDGEKIATGSLDTTVRVWSADSGQCLAVLQGHTSLVGQLQMSGDTLVTGSSDGSTRVWDLKKMVCVHRLAAHDNSVTTLQFDSRRIVTGGSDGRVKIWDIKTGHHIRDLACTFEAVWRVAFEDDKVVVLASRQNRTHMEVISFAPPADEIL